MQQDRISVDFYELDDECSNISSCAESISEICNDLSRVITSIENMRCGQSFSDIISQLEQSVSCLNRLADEEYDLSFKLKEIRKAYYQIEMDVCDFVDRISENKTELSFADSAFSPVYASEPIFFNEIYRGNSIQNEEWLDVLLNDFSLQSRKDKQ